MFWWSLLALVLAMAAALTGYAALTWAAPYVAEAMFLTFLCLIIVSIVLYFWPAHA